MSLIAVVQEKQRLLLHSMMKPNIAMLTSMSQAPDDKSDSVTTADSQLIGLFLNVWKILLHIFDQF